MNDPVSQELARAVYNPDTAKVEQDRLYPVLAGCLRVFMHGRHPIPYDSRFERNISHDDSRFERNISHA